MQPCSFGQCRQHGLQVLDIHVSTNDLGVDRTGHQSRIVFRRFRCVLGLDRRFALVLPFALAFALRLSTRGLGRGLLLLLPLLMLLLLWLLILF